MPTRTIVVGYVVDGTETTTTVSADRTERDRDGTLRAYADGAEIAEIPNATFAVAAEHYSA